MTQINTYSMYASVSRLTKYGGRNGTYMQMRGVVIATSIDFIEIGTTNYSRLGSTMISD